MDRKSFLKKYRLPLLEYALKDPLVDINCYFQNNKLNIRQLWIHKPKIKDSEDAIQKIVTKKDIDESQKRNSENTLWVFYNKNNILNEDTLSYILKLKGNLKEISKARGILWSVDLLERYKDSWDWNSLIDNSSIYWSELLIYKFENYLNFRKLSYRTNAEFNYQVIDRYKGLWDWNGLSGNPQVLKKLEDLILKHEKTVWVNKPNWPGYLIKSFTNINYNEMGNLNAIYEGSYENKFGLKPCICTSSTIHWTINKFNRYKDNIDFWLMALFANIDNEIIIKYGNELDENRFQRTVSTRKSDWYDSHPTYRNGWENLNHNKSFYLNTEIIKHLHQKKTKLIRYDGDARSGHSRVEFDYLILNLFNVDKLSLNFDELCQVGDKLPNNFISESFIHNNIYLNIIRPALIENPEIIRDLIAVI